MFKNILFTILCLPFLHASSFAQWGPDIKLSGIDSAYANENMGPCLAAHGDTVDVVWYSVKNSSSAVYYTRSTDSGKTFSPETKLAGTAYSADFPSIAQSNGTLHLVYREFRGTKYLSEYRQSLDGGTTWAPAVLLDTACWWPAVAASGSLVAVALNDTVAANNSEVFFRCSADLGATWEPVQRISDAPNRSEDPAIATDGANVHMAWNDKRSNIMQSYYRRSSDAGRTWQADFQVSNSSIMAYSPMVGVFQSHVDIVWEDRRSGVYEIYHRHSSDFGSAWEAEEAMTNSTPNGYYYPYLVRDGSQVHIVFFGNDIGYLHSSDGGAHWDAIVHLVDGLNHPTRPFIATAGSALNLLWTDTRNGYPAMYYKRNPTGNALTGTTAVEDGKKPLPANLFNAAPNPFTGFTTVPFHENEFYRVFDITGKEMRAYPGSHIAEDLPVGTYILKAENRSDVSIRIVKIK